MFVNTGPDEDKSSDHEVEENNTTPASMSSMPPTGLLKHSFQLVELLTNMPSVLELLSQAAQSSLDEQQRQVEQVAPVLEIFK